jgi:hypothetical protein
MKFGVGFGRSVTSPVMRKFAARLKASRTLPHAPMAMKSAALRGTRHCLTRKSAISLSEGDLTSIGANRVSKRSERARISRLLVAITAVCAGRSSRFGDGTPAFLNGWRVERQIFELDVEGHEFRIIKDKMNGDFMVPQDFTLGQKPQLSGRRKRKA